MNTHDSERHGLGPTWPALVGHGLIHSQSHFNVGMSLHTYTQANVPILSVKIVWISSVTRICNGIVYSEISTNIIFVGKVDI